MKPTIEQLQAQITNQCASLDEYHLLQEKWRKREAELEREISSLKKINDSLIKLGDRMESIIREGGKE